MHETALRFLSRFAPFYREAPSILEIGSLNLNGSPRAIFPAEKYFGIDLVEGPGVDEVSSGATFDTERRFDLVLCCEVFEHVRLAPEICSNAHRLLVPGGLFLVTAAGYGRTPHSAVDGEHLREGEYYRNVLELELRDWLKPFSTVLVDVSTFGDVYAMACKGELGVTLPSFSWVLISFQNDERIFRTLETLVAPTLRAWERRGSPLDVEILIVDNSPESPSRVSFVERLERTWRAEGLAPTKLLEAPKNLAYAGALNAAVPHASHDLLVYACSNHCTYHSEHWLEGLLEPFALHPRIAMTGSLFSSPPARLFGLPPVAPIHVQGGIFAARTAVLAAIPYDEVNDPHLHSDIRQSYRIAAAGHVLYPARFVRSLPVGSDDQGDPVGLVHDYAGSVPFARYEYRYSHDGEKGLIGEVHTRSARADLHKLGLP